MKALRMTGFDLKALAQDRRALALMLGLPLLLAALLGYGLAPLLEQNAYVEPFAVAVVDQDRTVETRTLVRQFETAPALRGLVTVIRTDFDGAMELLRADRAAAAVIIPDGFVRRMAAGENLPVTVIGNPARPLQAALIRQMMHSGADLVTAAQSGVNTVMHYLGAAGAPAGALDQWFARSVREFSLHALGRGDLLAAASVSAVGDVSPLQYYTVALGIALALVAAMAALPVNEPGRLLRLRAHGLYPAHVVVSQFLTLGALLLAQLLALYLPLAVWARGYFQGPAPWAAAALLATAAAGAALLVLVAAWAPTAAAANLAALALIAASALLAGAILPDPYLPPILRALGWLTPHKWAMRGLIHTFFDFDPAAAARSLAILAAMTGAALALAALRLARRWA